MSPWPKANRSEQKEEEKKGRQSSTDEFLMNIECQQAKLQYCDVQ